MDNDFKTCYCGGLIFPLYPDTKVTKRGIDYHLKTEEHAKYLLDKMNKNYCSKI